MTDQSPMSPKMSSAQLRKIKKPIIEKRRRERINDSLNVLKALVLDSLQKDESRYSKMEKADILEMTVRHLKGVQRQHEIIQAAEERNHFSKYRAGFSECAQEVSRYLDGACESLPSETHRRLMNHLADCAQKKATVCPTMTQGRLSPPSSTVTSPTATPLTSLPGSAILNYGQSIQQVMPRTTSPVSSCSSPSDSERSMISPVHTYPVSFPSSVVVVSPKPVHPQTPVNNAIPLYSLPHYRMADRHMDAQDTPTSIKSESRTCTRSPQAADDAPHMFTEKHDFNSNRLTMISSNPVIIPTCKSESRFQRQVMVCKSPVWRPW